MAETNCPRCNPEAKPRIRKLNRTDVCLICFNEGWTSYDKKCKQCGKDSGVYNICNECVELITENMRFSKVKITKKWVAI